MYLEVRQKYSAARRIFNSLLGVSSGDETLHLMFDILHETPRRELKIRRAAEYFLTNFDVFYLVMKHFVECLILLLKQNDFRRRN